MCGIAHIERLRVFMDLLAKPALEFPAPLTMDARRRISCAKDRKARVNFGNQRFASLRTNFCCARRRTKVTCSAYMRTFQSTHEVRETVRGCVVGGCLGPGDRFPHHVPAGGRAGRRARERSGDPRIPE